MTSTTTPGAYTPARSPAALIGAIGIPAGFGALLIAGLAVTVAIDKEPDNPLGVLIEDKKVVIPPPPPEPTPDKQVVEQPITPAPPTTERIVQPDAPVTLGESAPFIVTNLPDLPLGPIEIPAGIGTGSDLVPDPVATFAPVFAAPRNDPGRWITDRDYRSSWIRREMTGIARFSVNVDAAGRVSDCTITRSTSHAALDQATCNLISKRARFAPARDSAGEPTSGVYSSSVRWRLPD